MNGSRASYANRLHLKFHCPSNPWFACQEEMFHPLRALEEEMQTFQRQ